MKKITMCCILIVSVIFISIDTAHAFEIEDILTTSDIVDGNPQGKEIYFEPGDSVWVYVYTKNHSTGCVKNIDVKSVLYGPSGQIEEEIFYDILNHRYGSIVPPIYLRGYTPSWKLFEYESTMFSAHWGHCLPSWTPFGKYIVRVTIYDKSDNTQKTVELPIYVGTYTANEYLEKADSFFTNGKYEKAGNFYEKAEDEFVKFGVIDETYYCREKREKCEKYVQAEKYCSEADEYLKKRNYENAKSNFEKARKLYKELGDEDSVKKCDDQIRDNTGARLFIKELLEFPSAINLSLITWIAYIFLREFKRDEKKELLIIFVSIILIILSVFFIEFYFHKFFYATAFLLAIMTSTLILFWKTKRRVHTNPYIAGNPIRSKDIFFGRKDVFEFIKNKLSATKNITIVLHGERRTGKTSVLYQIENGRLGKNFIPVYIDVQEMAKVNETEFFIKITEKIVESLARNEIFDLKFNIYSEISELIGDYRSKSNPYRVFNKFLDGISNLLDEKYLILMFDEYEILERKIENKHLSPDIIQYLRSQMQSREKLSFIFAGPKKLEELGGKHWSMMFNAATYKKIGFLEKKDALDLIRVPVENRIHYAGEAVDKILRLTACHPYFLQLFLQNIVDHLHDIKKNQVKIEEVTHVVAYLLDNPSPHMIYIWQDSTDSQKMMLSALSEFIESEKEYISIKKIEENLNIPLDADAIKKTLNELYQKEILHCIEDYYNFRIDLLRHWIKTEHPLFKTLEEIL